jgi:hypothetical protein
VLWAEVRDPAYWLLAGDILTYCNEVAKVNMRCCCHYKSGFTTFSQSQRILEVCGTEFGDIIPNTDLEWAFGAVSGSTYEACEDGAGLGAFSHWVPGITPEGSRAWHKAHGKGDPPSIRDAVEKEIHELMVLRDAIESDTCLCLRYQTQLFDAAFRQFLISFRYSGPLRDHWGEEGTEGRLLVSISGCFVTFLYIARGGLRTFDGQ